MDLRQLQQGMLEWGPYTALFAANKQQHRDFAHAVLHLVKATGMLAAESEAADHDASFVFQRGIVGKALADIVITVLRLATVLPGGPLDLETLVVDRIRQKNPGWMVAPTAICTADGIESVRASVRGEGIGYTFFSKSAYDDVKDEHFHVLRRAFLKAAGALNDYIGTGSHLTS